MYEIIFTKQFEKDVKLAKKQGKDMNKLFNVIEKLANGEKLEQKYKDHNLSGIYSNCRECHIEPDWLLIYTIDNKTVVLVLNRTGTHSKLF